jgi:hypothetical protein
MRNHVCRKGKSDPMLLNRASNSRLSKYSTGAAVERHFKDGLELSQAVRCRKMTKRANVCSAASRVLRVLIPLCRWRSRTTESSPPDLTSDIGNLQHLDISASLSCHKVQKQHQSASVSVDRAHAAQTRQVLLEESPDQLSQLRRLFLQDQLRLLECFDAAGKPRLRLARTLPFSCLIGAT